jgi:DNA-binding winged helix-turn-helix (wHTH) protein
MSIVLHFDGFDADLAAGQLRRHGVRVQLRDQSFRVLESLLERPGEVVTREQLRQKLWPADVFVDFENNLNTAVGRLREALGDSAGQPRYIETLPKRGYRFLASVSARPERAAAELETVDPARHGAADLAVHQGGESASRRLEPVAYREYVMGRRHLDVFRNSGDEEQARVHLQNAIAADPEFSRAHQALAELYWFKGYLGLMAPRDAVAAGTLHAARALELDGTRAEPRALLAHFHKQFGYNWPDIHRALSHARAVAPNSTLVRLLYVVGWLMPQGRIDEGIADLEGVLGQAPDSTWTNHWLGILYVLGRRWDRLLAHANALIALDPISPWGYWISATVSRVRGAPDEAVEHSGRAVDLSGRWPFMLGWPALLLGIAGRVEEARAMLAELEELAQTRYVPPTSFAWAWLALRDVDRAFGWMDLAVEACDQFMMPLKTYQILDPLRDDPRFAGLLRKMKLDGAPPIA